MTDSDKAAEFIEETLQHWGYDPRKAHEYYMRTRKLVGRAAKKVVKTVDDLHTSDSERNESNAKAARIKALREKLDRLDKAADKLPLEKRKRAKDKIKKARKKVPSPPPGHMDFNDDARLDTSQIRDKRPKNDPTRGQRKKKTNG